jgi:hypothetical protein
MVKMPPMTIREYLKANKISPVAFAGMVGVTPQALYRYMAGDRQPRRWVVEQIILATHGKVQPSDLHVTQAAA